MYYTSLRSLILGLSVLLLFHSYSFSQKAPIKFGNVEKDDLEMTFYEKDSSASAVVLCDYGLSRIRYTNDDFELFFEKHIRIKILNEDGLDWANGEVQVYHKGADAEKVYDLKAITHNLVEGKIVKSKMKNSSEFKEKLDDNHDMVKFTLPDVRVGSVIEYTYKITSGFLFNFQDWTFQNTIPVVWSEYRTYIPEYYKYQIINKGHLPFSVSENIDKPSKITINTKTRTGGASLRGGTTNTDFKSTSISLMENYKRWVVQNAPAFKKEPLMTSPNNFISSVSYELAFIEWPREPRKDIMGTWTKLNTQYLESEYFGSPVSGSGFLKNEIEKLSIQSMSEKETVATIYQHVKNIMRWDGKYRKSLNSNLKKPYFAGEGSSAEINLILTSMLQKSGIQADPVLCSTRGHGFVQKSYPITGQFNNVLCRVTLEDNQYLLLDATDDFLPIDVLPQSCINSVGWAVSKNNSGWVDIVSNNKVSSKISGDIQLEDDGNLSGHLKMQYSGYLGRNKREKCQKDGNEVYINSRIDELDWEISELSLENESDLSSSFIEDYEVESFSYMDEMGDVIYLQPKLVDGITKNPFKSEVRTYPVDFPHPTEILYYVNIEIPEGFEVESMPAPFALSLPRKGGKYVIQYTISQNKINVYSKFTLNQRIFTTNEYPYLKSFYDQLIAKEKELIVLKKI